MLTIPLTDALGLEVDLQFDDKSDAAIFGLHALESKTSEIVTAAGRALDQTTFASCLLGGAFGVPSINVGTGVDLAVKSGANVTVAVHRSSDGALFDSGDASPDIPMGKGQAWVSFGVETKLDIAAGATSPSGFGVTGEAIGAQAFRTFALIESANGNFPTLKESVETALSEFRVLRTAADIREQPVSTVCEWDVSGTFAVTGSYGYSLVTNPFCLATARLPLHQQIKITPALEMSLQGTLAVTGEFRGRCYRVSESRVELGLYKKKESDLSATFGAEGGISGNVGSTDLIAKLFGALPGANFDAAQVPEADRIVMEAALKSAIDQGFSIGLNGICSASTTHEAAVLYRIDLSSGGDLESALNAALKGDWSALSKARGAKELRNVLKQTHDSGWRASLNLLGIYNCASVAEFVRQSTILHNLENGAITITDKGTAQRIAVLTAPFLAADEKLRKVLEESFLATAAYTAAGGKTVSGSALQLRQSLSIYKARTDDQDVRKDLRLGTALQLVSEAEIRTAAVQKDIKYFRVQARASFDGEDALRLFFSDTGARTAHEEKALKLLGRRVLAGLLDPGNAADHARLLVLNNGASWAEMDAQKFPPAWPASYSDWYDITFWAHAIATVGPRLKAVLAAAEAAGIADPAKDPRFMAAREALAKALAEVTRKTRAAFEKGWPIAVMVALSGGRAPAAFTVAWDGKTRFAKESGKVLTA